LFAFLGYHLYLVSKNQTTNEAFKRRELLQLLKKEEIIIKDLIFECENWSAEKPL
jgi:hypothetical protein